MRAKRSRNGAFSFSFPFLWMMSNGNEEDICAHSFEISSCFLSVILFPILPSSIHLECSLVSRMFLSLFCKKSKHSPQIFSSPLFAIFSQKLPFSSLYSLSSSLRTSLIFYQLSCAYALGSRIDPAALHRPCQGR